MFSTVSVIVFYGNEIKKCKFQFIVSIYIYILFELEKG
jgi:hypothetical protein